MMRSDAMYSRLIDWIAEPLDDGDVHTPRQFLHAIATGLIIGILVGVVVGFLLDFTVVIS